jgi:hypothetical protein
MAMNWVHCHFYYSGITLVLLGLACTVNDDGFTMGLD